jgi:hypothetical protein
MIAAGGCAVLAALGGGCRQDAPVQPPAAPPAHLQWQAGDSFVFDTWSLDQSGIPIPSSRSTSIRRVLRTGVRMEGFDSVTVMLDSIAVPGAPLRRDTLFFYQSGAGDLWQYGLLASIGRKYFGSAVPSRWDLSAALSVGINGGWTAGQVDSVTDVVGVLLDEPVYAAASVNGTSIIFKTERVQLTGPPAFEFDLWLPVSLPLFARILETPSPDSDGLDRVLVAAHVGG